MKICGFAKVEWGQEFADLRFADFLKKFAFPSLLTNQMARKMLPLSLSHHHYPYVEVYNADIEKSLGTQLKAQVSLSLLRSLSEKSTLCEADDTVYSISF
jgi:hypothetical protein